MVVVRNKGQKYYSLARSPLRLPGSADFQVLYFSCFWQMLSTPYNLHFHMARGVVWTTEDRWPFAPTSHWGWGSTSRKGKRWDAGTRFSRTWIRTWISPGSRENILPGSSTTKRPQKKPSTDSSFCSWRIHIWSISAQLDGFYCALCWSRE